MRGWLWLGMGLLSSMVALAAKMDETAAPTRTWTNRTTNKQLKMSLVKIDAAMGTVTLLDPVTARSIETPLTHLSDYDLDYLRTLATAGDRSSEAVALDTATTLARKNDAAANGGAAPGPSVTSATMPPRTWTRTDKKAMEASLVGRDATTVWLLKVGADQPSTIALNQLSQADQDYVKGLPPGLLFGPPDTAVPVPMPAAGTGGDLAAATPGAADMGFIPAAPLPPPPKPRLWTNASGKTFEGVLLDYTNGYVTLKRLSDGKVTVVRLTSLVQADQEYVRKHAKPDTADLAPAPLDTEPAPAPAVAPAAPAVPAPAPAATSAPAPAKPGKAPRATAKPAAGDDDVPSSGGSGTATGNQVKGMVKGLINGHPGTVE